MKTFQGLIPGTIWKYFEEICEIPRPSKKEEKILEYLIEFGEKNNLFFKKDAVGNIIFRKPAAKGKENLKSVVLQSHVDMVVEKNIDIVHDFEKDPIQPFINGDWIKARGTTLGADDGIGMAAQMAILTEENIEHGPIECLFTIDEESGMTGAFEIKPGFMKSKILLNLDSEDEGELFIGCAGGIDTIAYFSYQKEVVPVNSCAYKIFIKGLKGGHSGDDIEKGLGNSNKILNRFLWEIKKKFDLRITNFDGGNLRNAIPREAYAIITIPYANKESLENYFNIFASEIKNEFVITEPNPDLFLELVNIPEFVIDRKTQDNLLNALYGCPHGVIAWSQQIKGLVETSTNLASVKFENEQIIVTTSQRSSVDSAKIDIANMVESVFLLAGARVKHSEGYPGWTPNTNSEILNITESSYQKLFNKKPIVRAIHAGLECGLFLKKYPDLDMISFGPTIRGVHSPDERLNIGTVEKFWDLLIEVLHQIPKEKRAEH